MANVGFYGGSTVRELGPASDMRAFFGCIGLAVRQLPSGDGGLLTDRLYRRYVRFGDLDRTKALVIEVQEILAGISTRDIDWESLGTDRSFTKLDLDQQKLADTFQIYLESACDIIENAQSFERRFHAYEPVMTIISDTPRFLIDSNKSLTQYDNLQGEPFWLR